MKLDNLHSIYFIGIGGIGMSALARYFRGRGVQVSGYDRTESDITTALQAEGIDIKFEDDPTKAPLDVDLVIYTPAIPRTHQQLNLYRNKKYPVYKRSEVLEEITRNAFTIAVAGTHGKTSITTLITYLLHAAGKPCMAFLGGVSLDFNGNFVSGDEDLVVVEADEYDRSFLRLHPNVAVVSAIDPDHLDIYGTAEAMEEAYATYLSQLAPDGTAILKHGLKIKPDHGRVIEYALDPPADVFASNIEVVEGYFHFDVTIGDRTWKGCRLGFPGRHNIENVLAALAVVHAVDGEMTKAIEALPLFKGIKRRFEYWLRKDNVVYIDDYAHHPAEIKACLQAVRELYPHRKLTAIFQPHLYSRTRDLASGLAESLSAADEVVLLDIYPAREEPIPGVTTQLIYDQLKVERKWLTSKSALLDTLKAHIKPDVVVTLGAGDIDRLVAPVANYLKGIAA